MSTTTAGTTTASTTLADLSVTRLNLMRSGYLLMGVGLVVVKWPLLPQAHTMPLFEGVTLCLLTAMSLLAFLGLRYPVKLLPVLLFESAWKILWLSLVALPEATAGTMDAATTDVLVNCSLVVVILAVTPWPHVWRTYVRAAGDRWR
jgi:hypothetical protein